MTSDTALKLLDLARKLSTGAHGLGPEELVGLVAEWLPQVLEAANTNVGGVVEAGTVRIVDRRQNVEQLAQKAAQVGHDHLLEGIPPAYAAVGHFARAVE